MNFQPVKKENLTDAIVGQVRTEILKGTYKAGDRLPSERELALMFAVNRTTVREAMAELEHLGLVERRQGEGCIVLDYHETGSIDLLRHMLTRPDMAGRFDLKAIESVCETAGIIYSGAAEMAARQISPGEIKALRELCRSMDGAIAARDVDRAMDLDRRFHRTVFAATRSIALELLSNTFFEIIRTYEPYIRILMQGEIDRHPDRMRTFYHHLLDALHGRDAVRAASLVRRMVTPSDPDLWKQVTGQAGHRS